jgi:hypothetical protein
MVTTAELNRRGLRYAVVVDAAATPASLQALDRQGLPYLVEVADGATMASRRALEARGLRYLVPVLGDATAASKASLAAQGLRYAVQVDADILPADRLVLQRQGLTYYVEVDSSGNSVSAAAVGGGALLTGETDGFATDFLYATDAQRVALKTGGSTVSYAVDAFYANAGTSPKMVYDAAGMLGWSPHNYLTQSQTIDVWNANSNTTVVANQAVAPDGTTTMDKVYPASSGSNRWVANTSVASPVTLTYSIYAKAAGKRWIYFLKFDGSNFGAWFDLQNGVVGNVDAAYTSSIQDVGGGVYRCIFTGPGENTPNNAIGISDANGSGSVTVNATDGVYLWGAQMNRGSVPTAYLPTTTAARVGLALDYDPVTHAAKGLLCEPQATNGQTRSSDFTTSWGPNDATVSANIVTAPNGLTEADALIPAAGLGRPFVNWTSTTTAATVTTYSLFAKNGTLGTNWIEVQIGGAPTVSAWFNLATGVVGTATGSPISRTITAVGNGWYRLTVTFTAGAGSAATYLCADDADGGTSGTGDGTKSAFYLWGTQMESGTVATSPIPTLAATVTRAGDQVNVTPASINYSATAGSWWVDLTLLNAPGGARIIGHPDSNTPMYQLDATNFSLYDSSLISRTVASTTVASKVACAFQNGSRAITANGLAAVPDAVSAASLLATSSVLIGTNAGGANPINGYIRQLRYVPRRKTNAELVTETT